jgi:hypothetical protein
MIERKSSFSSKLSSIPNNIIFIGCCNPFRLDMSNQNTDHEQEVGLVIESSSNKLSHKVYPISDSLLPFIYDFGQLSHEDEKKYIVSIINQNTRFNHDDGLKNIVAEVISSTQKKVREIENDSSASLRDVKRFVDILEFYLSWEVLATNPLNAIVITTVICYVLRIAAENHKREIFSKIKDITKLGSNLQQLFDDFATQIATEAM